MWGSEPQPVIVTLHPATSTAATSHASARLLLATTLLAAAVGCVHAQSAAAAEVACPIDRGPVTTNVLFRVLPLRIRR